jgi:ADP-heptose:LPS heptosyltransferase
LELTGLLGRLACCGDRLRPAHIAAGLGVPTVTLFGPTDLERNIPCISWCGPRPCSPCDLLACPVAGHPCMTGLRANALAWMV